MLTNIQGYQCKVCNFDWHLQAQGQTFLSYGIFHWIEWTTQLIQISDSYKILIQIRPDHFIIAQNYDMGLIYEKKVWCTLLSWRVKANQVAHSALTNHVVFYILFFIVNHNSKPLAYFGHYLTKCDVSLVCHRLICKVFILMKLVWKIYIWLMRRHTWWCI